MSHVVYHEGHQINLTHDLEFKVSGPEFVDVYRTEFGSLREAKAAIDEAIQIAARAKARARTTKLVLLDEAGEVVTITGINRSTRQLTGLKRDRADDVYPNVPWIKTALQELEKIEADVRSRQAQLHPFGIDTKRGYGRVDVDNYDGIVDALEKEVREKTVKAQKGPPERKPAERRLRL